jgi:hypothetical protein
VYNAAVALVSDMATLLQQVRVQTRDQFAAEWTGWFLMSSPLPAVHLRFITEPEEPPTQTPHTPTPSRFELQRIAKATGQPNADRISVGRARNCDVVVRHPSVSKLHAHFRLDGEHLALLDNSSRNGTWVNREPAIPERRVPLKSGDRVRLGSVETIIFDGAALYDFLR